MEAAVHFKQEDSFFDTLFDEPSRFLCTEVKQEGEKNRLPMIIVILSGICIAV